MNLPFINELRAALSELGEVTDKFDSLSAKRDLLRNQIKKWMEMNNLNEYEIMDSQDYKLWRMSIYKTTRTTANVNTLRQVLSPEQFSEVTNTSESESFKCQTVKKSKESSKPKAPSQR